MEFFRSFLPLNVYIFKMVQGNNGFKQNIKMP